MHSMGSLTAADPKFATTGLGSAGRNSATKRFISGYFFASGEFHLWFPIISRRAMRTVQVVTGFEKRISGGQSSGKIVG